MKARKRYSAGARYRFNLMGETVGLTAVDGKVAHWNMGQGVEPALLVLGDTGPAFWVAISRMI